MFIKILIFVKPNTNMEVSDLLATLKPQNSLNMFRENQNFSNLSFCKNNVKIN